MTTGYTAGVKDGTITDFGTFALQCARAFGACVLMRDDPADAPIPQRFEPSDYHVKALRRAKAEIDLLRSMPLGDLEAHVATLRAETAARNAKYATENTEARERYTRMLARVREWAPPTPDHVGLRDFMISQIKQSIDFDCRDQPYAEPLPGAPGDWLESRCIQLENDIAYHTREHAKEVERAASRTDWVAQLRASLETKP